MDTNFKKEDKAQGILRFNDDGSLYVSGLNNTNRIKIRENNFYKSEDDLDIFGGKVEDINYTDDKEYHLDDDVSGFNLYSKDKRLNSLKFSNGKTQEDVVKEITNSIKNGKRIIFIRGMCGTGKSVIALNIAKNFNKTSIVVPGKVLQRQYMEDYSNEKYVLKDNHKKLKIKVITGRENHKCLFLDGENADHKDLPCKIELVEKNLGKLREYLKQNPKVKNDLDIKEIRRMSVAPVCPYWSPIVPSDLDLGLKSEKRNYKSINNGEFTIYNRKSGCSYYEQFNSYIDADSIVFNSSKYKLENSMNRKPSSEVEIIDECDEFLDSFSNIKKINLNRFLNSLNFVSTDNQELKESLLKLATLLNEIISENSFKERTFKKDPIKLTETNVKLLFDLVFESRELFDNVDEDNYSKNVLEIVLDFYDFLNESYILFYQEEKGLFLEVVSTNLSGRFKELLDKNKTFVLMSGTIHSYNILRNVFGLDNFEIIEAETVNNGSINVIRTGFEIDCKYENFKNNNVSREEYLVALDEAVKKSVKPTLVHVNSFDDLPSRDEKENYMLDNLMTKSELIESQRFDYGKMFREFKDKKIDVLFTTKCSRGVDFPGEQCNSIVFTKFPNPDANSIFWKILKKTHSFYYWDFYKDKANREFLQKIYRGVRSKDDKVYVLSPDKRVLDAVLNLISLNNKSQNVINY